MCEVSVHCLVTGSSPFCLGTVAEGGNQNPVSDPTAELIKNRVLLLRTVWASSPSGLTLTALLLMRCSGQTWFCVPCFAGFTCV